MPAEADEIEAAVNAVLDAGYRTADMMAEGCTKVGCTEMGDKIFGEYLKASPAGLRPQARVEAQTAVGGTWRVDSKLSPKVTDEGRPSRSNPFMGNCGKPAPHPTSLRSVTFPRREAKMSPDGSAPSGEHFYFSITSRQGRFSASSLRRWLRQTSSAASAAPNRMTAARLGRPTVGSSGVIHLSTNQNSTNHKNSMAAVMAPYRTPFFR